MGARVDRLGKIQAVTGVDGETRVCVDWRKCMLGMSPATTRELAAALLAVADEAEAIDAAAGDKPVQDSLWKGVA
jgi:hypothetical protein